LEVLVDEEGIGHQSLNGTSELAHLLGLISFGA
jgi:hypothetical protein